MMRSRSFWTILAIVSLAHAALFVLLGNMSAFHLPGRSREASFVAPQSLFRSEWASPPVPEENHLGERHFTVPTRFSPATSPQAPSAPPPKIPYHPLPSFPKEANPAIIHGFGQHWKTSRIILVLDVSGSMMEPQTCGNSRYATARQEIYHLLAQLPENTQFNVVLFAERSVALAPAPLPATPTFLQEARRFILSPPDAGATTDLRVGIENALLQQPQDVLLVTDGFSNQSAATLPTELRYLRDRLSPAVRLHFIGIQPEPPALDALRRLSLSLHAGFALWEGSLRTALR